MRKSAKSFRLSSALLCCAQSQRGPLRSAGYAQLVAMLHVNPTILALSHSGNSPLAGHAERIKELLMVRRLIVAHPLKSTPSLLLHSIQCAHSSEYSAALRCGSHAAARPAVAVRCGGRVVLWHTLCRLQRCERARVGVVLALSVTGVSVEGGHAMPCHAMPCHAMHASRIAKCPASFAWRDGD